MTQNQNWYIVNVRRVQPFGVTAENERIDALILTCDLPPALREQSQVTSQNQGIFAF